MVVAATGSLILFIYLLFFNCLPVLIRPPCVQVEFWIGMGNQRVTWERVTCHACLHAFTDCSGAGSPPCVAVAKLRLGNRFSVAKLVT